MKLPSPRNHPYKVSYLLTWQLLKMLLHLELRQCRWAENLILVEKIVYPMISSSPLKISIECLLILDRNNVSLMWQEYDGILKYLLSNVMNHAGPNIPIYDELEIIIIWHHINHMAHLIRKQMFCYGGHTISHAPLEHVVKKVWGISPSKDTST